MPISKSEIIKRIMSVAEQAEDTKSILEVSFVEDDEPGVEARGHCGPGSQD